MNYFDHTVTDRGDHVLLTLTGDLDLAAHTALRSEINALLDAGRALAVDCAGLTFMDSMGLRVLVEGLRRADSEGLAFELISPSAPVRRVLDLSGTAGLFKVRESEQDELGS